MPKQTVNKKPAAPKRTTKPKAKTTTKTTPKPKAKTTTKPKPRTKAKPKPKVPAYAPAELEVEYPYDMFPWKLIHNERGEKRSCYFQCEEHRKKHIARYKMTKKDIIFMGYKYD
jgi:outer membrane biosynthesis protein TonB